MVRDPVCGMEIDEDSAEAVSEYEGQEYFFCSVECKEEFDNEPELYAEPRAGGAGGD